MAIEKFGQGGEKEKLGRYRKRILEKLLRNGAVMCTQKHTQQQIDEIKTVRHRSITYRW